MSDGHIPSRVPETGKSGWTHETQLDHLLAIINEKQTTVIQLIQANDKRYEERFLASQKALDIGFMGQREAINTAFAASGAAVNAAFAAQRDAITAALASADRAVAKAEAATEKRFESVNEFRSTLDNQQRTLIPRSEVSVMVEGLNEKIGQLTKLMDGLQSERIGARGGYGYAFGLLGLILTLISLGVLIYKATQS